MFCLILQPHRQFITNGYSILSQLLTSCYAKRMAWPIPRKASTTDFWPSFQAMHRFLSQSCSSCVARRTHFLGSSPRNNDLVGCNENQNDPFLTKINSNSRVNNCELGILANVKLPAPSEYPTLSTKYYIYELL